MDTLESNCKHKRAHSPFLLRSTGPVASPYAIATIVQGAFARTPYGLVVAHAAGTEQRRFIALPVAAAATATATAVATTIPLYVPVTERFRVLFMEEWLFHVVEFSGWPAQFRSPRPPTMTRVDNDNDDEARN
ncbi:hypothetical protein HZH68_013709 [Vespula germanica]|uniref:Uncharacterized protein n=1 Tax=Vespula germanica TaxID=30212 RepID=A0A834MVL2_VESGE|nr:hypothetical protein HZH68_013709 [Vespula germanica]